jgi:hypothetical protein
MPRATNHSPTAAAVAIASRASAPVTSAPVAKPMAAPLAIVASDALGQLGVFAEPHYSFDLCFYPAEDK